MRRVGEQAIALPQGFAHQAEFAILQITQTAMEEAGGSTAGAGAEVTALGQDSRDSLQRQFSQCANADDTAADDEDLAALPLAQGSQISCARRFA